MKLKVFDTAGKELREIDAADEVFGIEPNRSVLHQAYVAQMGNQRGGNAHTKSRGEVRGSTVKIRKQKGLGRSRQGSIRASHHVGGGVAFGPKHHSFAKALPRTMKRLALRSALSSPAAGGSLLLVEGLGARLDEHQDLFLFLDRALPQEHGLHGHEVDARGQLVLQQAARDTPRLCLGLSRHQYHKIVVHQLLRRSLVRQGINDSGRPCCCQPCPVPPGPCVPAPLIRTDTEYWTNAFRETGLTLTR